MQMSEVIGEEALFFGLSILVGMGLVLVYDVFRILRRVIRHGSILIGIEDILFWILCTITVFVLLYRENDGMLRLFTFIGIMVGMGIYYGLFSRFILRFFVWLLGGVLKGIQKGSTILFGPVIKIVRKVVLFLKKQLKKLYKAIKIGLCKL